uniref:D-dopachrome decarboxylase n=1 Tax=Acrobeloides nanus TaxID=290746 RepID=A0A914CXI0_9BILA
MSREDKMPLATLTTNLPDEKFPSDFNKAFSEFLAVLFNKPAANFVLLVDPGRRFTIGGTTEPAVMLVIKSVGSYNETSNIEYSKKISDYVKETLGVGNDRCVIHFQAIEAYEVGKHGTTLKEFLKK